MKSKYQTILPFVVILSLIFLWLGFREWLFFGIAEPHIIKVPISDSRRVHVALYNSGGLRGSAILLGVIDDRGPETSIIELGTVQFGNNPALKRIVMSSDNTVIASESSSDSKRFWFAFDLLNSTSYGEVPYTRNDPNSTNARTQAVQMLIQSRGGIGHEIQNLNRDLLYKKANRLSWFAWRVWRHQKNRARNANKAIHGTS
jgi:hypothetical protein